MRESRIETRVTEDAKKLGWRSIKLNGGGDRGKPDRLYFKGPPPRLKIIEYKRPGEDLDPLQVYWYKILNKMGFDIHVVDDYDQGIALFRGRQC